MNLVAIFRQQAGTARDHNPGMHDLAEFAKHYSMPVSSGLY